MRAIVGAILSSVVLAHSGGVAVSGVIDPETSCLFLDGFESGDLCTWTGDCAAPFPAAGVSAEIQNARSTPDGPAAVAINGALVTYVKETIGVDPGGFFVQAELAGPALFVAVDSGLLSPPPAPGDIVSFTITEMGTSSGLRQAQTITGWSVTASGPWVPCSVQNVSATDDLVTNLDDYESEMVSLRGTIAESFSSAGTGFEAAQLDTAGISGDPDLRLRIATVVNDEVSLDQDCDLELAGSPLWRFMSQAHPSVWRQSDLALVSCPDPSPVVTEANLIIDASACTGSSGRCIAGDMVVFIWDNSNLGDDNPDVSTLAQVEFDLSAFGLGNDSPDSVNNGVFSYSWVVVAGSIDAAGLTFAATVTDDASNLTGPVVSSDSVEVDSQVPTVTSVALAIDDADCGGGPCGTGDQIEFSWDNSSVGDHNADVVAFSQVSFDLSAVGGSSNQIPDTIVGNVFIHLLTVTQGSIDATGLSFSATVTDDAGNVTGPVTSSDTVDVDNQPPMITARITADVDFNGQIDRIRLTFGEAINDSSVEFTDFAVAGMTIAGGLSGTADDAEYSLMLTESGSPDTDAVPEVSYTAGGLEDLAGNLLASESGVAAEDEAAPVVIIATASDASGGGAGIQADDAVTIVFSEDTTQPTIDSSNVDAVLALNNGHSYLDGDSIDGASGWTAGNTLVILLDTSPVTPTVAVGDTIQLNSSGPVVMDASGNGLSGVVFSAIGGSF